MRRIVVKVGSNVLTREDGQLNVTRMSAIGDQIVWLRRHDYEVILVSSGAVAAGRAELHVDHHLDSVEQRQLFSAIGQGKLVRSLLRPFPRIQHQGGTSIDHEGEFRSPRNNTRTRRLVWS